MSTATPFPLEKVTEDQLQLLGESLWCWFPEKDCATLNCSGCDEEGCIPRRLKRLSCFFGHYKQITSSYEPQVVAGEQGAFNSHDDIVWVIKQLKLQPDVPRGELVTQIFASTRFSKPPPSSEQQFAINLAVQIMFMVNCSAQRQRIGLLEHGMRKVEWRDDFTLAQFIGDIFQMTDHPSINDTDTTISQTMKTSLMARKLKKVAGLKFRPTDDLRHHLKLDEKTGMVDVFHHTAFLKEHLRLTKDAPADISITECLRRGALPRQLALETLDSIQKILFPLSDTKSYSLLRSLTSTASFDPDCLRFESTSIRNAHEKDIQYLYFGSRLADLYEELENPRPRSWVERFLERKSRARHVMMATVIGVVVAILLGIASLGVGGYQAWIGYQQWQHPISGGSG